MKDLYNKIEESANYIKSKINISPSIGLILGSGLGVLADEIENPIKIKYDEIPNFPVSTVQGHAGQLVIGKLQGKNVIAMQGRFHYYEGYSMEMITFPVRVMKSLGVETIFVTNAAGGANRDFKPGDLMIITDHINLSGNNPLIGPNDNRIGTRFPDMSAAYTKEYIELARKCANKLNIKVSIEDIKSKEKVLRNEDFIDKKYDFSKVDFIEAEINANLSVERAIEKEFSLNPSLDKLNYLYNRIKLNNSEKYQIIAYLEGPKFCTSRGGTVIILEEKNNNYVLTSKIKDVIPPIIISENISNGYNDLIVRSIKKDKLDFRVLKYNGNSYPINPIGEEKLETGIRVVGVAVISDDLFYRRGIEY